MSRRAHIALALAAVLASPATAVEAAPAPDTLPALRDVGIEQRLGASVPLDLKLRDEAGETVELGRYFGERPVILALVYYECPMLCTLVLNGLISSLKALAFDAGREFDVVAVSFDPEETPALAAAKKETYLDSYRRPNAAAGFHFLTGDAESIRRLAEAVGFHYRYDPASDEFAHAAGITVLTPTGVIARYFYGVEYAPRDVRLGLIEAAEEKIGSAVDQLLLYCFRYDPHTGRYSAAVLNLVRLGGVLTVVTFAGFVIVARSREKKTSKV